MIGYRRDCANAQRGSNGRKSMMQPTQLALGVDSRQPLQRLNKIFRRSASRNRPSASGWLSLLASLAFILSLTGYASAGTETIQAAEVEVRSGPSLNPSYYPTSKLYRGDKVTVVKEYDKDWLAIEPPAPGRDSFSWINAQAVKVNGMSAIVVV